MTETLRAFPGQASPADAAGLARDEYQRQIVAGLLVDDEFFARTARLRRRLLGRG